LYGIASEPVHPQALCLIIVVFLVAVWPFLVIRRPAAGCAVAGLLTAMLLLTKINVGLFVGLALILWLSAATPGWTAYSFRLATSLAILALPALLMHSHLNQPWAKNYAVIVTLSALPVIWLQRDCRNMVFHFRHWLAGFVTALVAAITVIAATLMDGTTTRSMFDAIFSQPARFPSTFFITADMTTKGVATAALSVLLFFGSARFKSAKALWLIRLGKFAFAAFTLYQLSFLDFFPVLNYALPFAWLVAVAEPAANFDGGAQAARRLLALVLVLHSLIAYPVAGTQQALATFLLGVAGIVCLTDVGLAVWKTASPHANIVRPAWAIQTMATLGLLGGIGYLAWSVRQHYLACQPLGMQGASWLRLPEPQTAVYRWLVANLEAKADALATMPGLGSLYLWSGFEPVSSQNPTNWMTVLDSEDQKRCADRLASYARPCVVRNLRLARQWLRGQSIDDLPLVRFISEDFRTLGSVQSYEFRVRNSQADDELVACIAPPLTAASQSGSASIHWEGTMNLPAWPGASVRAMQLANASSGVTILDTRAPSSLGRLEVFSAGPGPKVLDLLREPLNLSEERRLGLTITTVVPMPLGQVMVIRLLDAQGKVITSVPFLE
jgi:hypothetical protein